MKKRTRTTRTGHTFSVTGVGSLLLISPPNKLLLDKLEGWWKLLTWKWIDIVKLHNFKEINFQVYFSEILQFLEATLELLYLERWNISWKIKYEFEWRTHNKMLTRVLKITFISKFWHNLGKFCQKKYAVWHLLLLITTVLYYTDSILLQKDS